MIVLGMAQVAWSKTLHIPSEYGTLESALASAGTGDVIEINVAGTYSFASGSTHTGDLTITSTVAGRDDVVLAGAFTNTGDLALEHLWLNVTPPRVGVYGSVELTDVHLTGNGTQIMGLTGSMVATSIVVTDSTLTSEALYVQLDYSFEDVVATNVHAPALITASGTGEISHVIYRCSLTTSVFNGLNGYLTLRDSLFLSEGGALLSNADASLSHVTAKGFTGFAAIYGYDIDVTDSVFEDGSAIYSPAKTGASMTATRSVYHDIDDPFPDGGGPSSGLTEVDPMLSATGDPCEEGGWPMYGSPLVDAGDPADVDLDGSPADIGASGGSTALDFVPDADADGVNASRDCDDNEPLRRPNVPDSVGDGFDQNCDEVDGTDADGDGYAGTSSGGGDCDDADVGVHPDQTDTVGDGVDQDCDELDGVDSDGDKHASLASGGDDCDDTTGDRHPGAGDTSGNTVDENCDGSDGIDDDGDGHASEASGGDDCDDTDSSVYPEASDPPTDGIDTNCDGADGVDADGDGTVNADDCAPNDPARYPGADDAFGDDVDQDCDGTDGIDADGDVHASTASGGDDCDDTNPDAFPGATEDKGGADLDCDGKASPGCGGCQSSGSPATIGVFALLAGLALRRRRG